MRIVIAPDSFKESMTAGEAATAIQNGIREVFPDAETLLVPVADGGEGTVAAVLQSTGGKVQRVRVHDPLMRPVVAAYGIPDDGQTALIEMAAASGLELLKPYERNPMQTTTYGTGELIRDAVNKNCGHIIVGLGGSATNDCGAGIMQALGVRFLTTGSKEIKLLTGGVLNRVQHLDVSRVDPNLRKIQFTIATDVDNPLLGTQGATRVFAPQKGADDQMIEILEKNLHHFAGLVEQTFGKEIRNVPGAGAAGGIGAGLLAFLNASIEPGFEIVARLTRLEEHIQKADLVITGEGKLDAQSRYGKTPLGVAALAKKYHVPALAFAGQVTREARELYKNDFREMIRITDPAMEHSQALMQGKELLEQAARKYFLSVE